MLKTVPIHNPSFHFRDVKKLSYFITGNPILRNFFIDRTSISKFLVESISICADRILSLQSVTAFLIFDMSSEPCSLP